VGVPGSRVGLTLEAVQETGVLLAKRVRRERSETFLRVCRAMTAGTEVVCVALSAWMVSVHVW